MKAASYRTWVAVNLLAFMGLTERAVAQEAPPTPAGWVLKATPQHLVLSGYWLEAEHARAGHPRQSFSLGPQLYWGPTGRPDAPRDLFYPNRDGLVHGVGVQAQQRFYLSKNVVGQVVPRGFYLGYGPQVQYFNLHFSRLLWHEETGSGGLPYLLYGPVRYREAVLRYGVAAQAGYQWLLGRRAVLDVYAGLGVRQSHYWSPFAESQYQSGPSDYAHEGFYVPAGFKLGVAL